MENVIVTRARRAISLVAVDVAMARRAKPSILLFRGAHMRSLQCFVSTWSHVGRCRRSGFQHRFIADAHSAARSLRPVYGQVILTRPRRAPRGHEGIAT